MLFLASHLLLAASCASDVVMSPTFGFISSTCSSHSAHWSHSQGSWGSPPHFLWVWQNKNSVGAGSLAEELGQTRLACHATRMLPNFLWESYVHKYHSPLPCKLLTDICVCMVYMFHAICRFAQFQNCANLQIARNIYMYIYFVQPGTHIMSTIAITQRESKSTKHSH